MGKITTLEALRREAGLTQGQLAQRLNCTPASVSQWENGSRLTSERARQVFGVLQEALNGQSTYSIATEAAAKAMTWAITPSDLARPWDEILLRPRDGT